MRLSRNICSLSLPFTPFRCFSKGSLERAVPAMLLGALLFAPAGVFAQKGIAASQNASPSLQSLQQSSLAFVPNRGQYPAEEKFAAAGPGYSVSIKQSGVTLTIPGDAEISGKRVKAGLPSPSLGMELIGGNPNPVITAQQPLLQKNSFIPASDPKTWISNVPSYARVDYSSVYKDVDLAFYGNGGRLEYDFTLQPNADASAIRLALTGAQQAEVNAQGDLVLQIRVGDGQKELRFLKPVAYQLSADGRQKQSVEAAYQLSTFGAGQALSFTLGSFDHTRALVIDPVLVYGEFLTNVGFGAFIQAVTADQQGNAYVAGTNAGDPLQFYVKKLDPNGNVLLNVEIGDTSNPVSEGVFVAGIAVDSSGNIFLAGSAGLSIPTTSTAFQQSLNSDAYDPFLFVLKADGSGPIYSTYFGGSSGIDSGDYLAIDSEGKAYISGDSESSDFPITPGAYQSGRPPFEFVAKFDPTLSGTASLLYSTAVVNSDGNQLFSAGLAVDKAGNAYVLERGDSSGFPVTSGAYNYSGSATDFAGVFVTKVNPTGSGLVYSADLGPGNPAGIAVDGNGEAFVTGSAATGFPTTAGAYQSSPVGPFAASLSADGSSLLYSTFLGGSGTPSGIALLPGCVTACAVYINGSAGGMSLPLVNPIQDFESAFNDAEFLLELAPGGGSLVYSTYLSPANVTDLYTPYPPLAVDGLGNAYLSMVIIAADAPVTPPFLADPFVGNQGFAGYLAKVSPANSSLVLALPLSVDFPTQPINESTTQAGQPLQSVELRNLGSKPVNLQLPFNLTSSDFMETDNCTSQLPAGGLCTLNFSFTPSSIGTEDAKLTIASDAPDSPTTLSLSGNGPLPVTPASLTFADQVLGSFSAPSTVTVTNTGDRAVSLGFDVVGNDPAEFTTVSNCPPSLPVTQSCQTGVTFTPAQLGLRTAQLKIIVSGVTASGSIPLSGTGVSSSVSPGTGSLVIEDTALNFGTLLVGTTSGAQAITLFNDGLVPVQVSSATAATRGQTGSSDFQVAPGTCALPQQLLPESSCTLIVTFTPSIAAAEIGDVTIADSTAASPGVVALSGIGVATVQTLEIFNSNLVFPDQVVGTTSSVNSIFINSIGTQSVTVGQVSITGDFQIANSSNCAGATLSAGGPQTGCEVDVTFTPTATGTRTGTLTLMDSASNTPQIFNLMGTGVAVVTPPPPHPPTGTPQVLPTLDFGTQQQGVTSPDQAMPILNSQNLSAEVTSLAITGANAHDFAIDTATTTCKPLPLILSSSSGQCTVNLTFTPSQASGTENATLVVGTLARDLNVSLTGTAEASTMSYAITPRTMVFDARQSGSTNGSPYYAYITNTGTEDVTISGPPSFSGSNPSDFQVSAQDTCSSIFNSSTPLTAGHSCEFRVQFTPTTTEAESALLSLDGSAGPLTMTVTGQGTPAEPATTVFPETLAFDMQQVGTRANSLPVTIVNNSSNPIVLNQAVVTGTDFPIDFEGDDCSGQTVTIDSGPCQIYIVFAPTAAGYRTGGLTITDQNNNTYSMSFAGWGASTIKSAKINPSGLEFTSVVAGTLEPSSLYEVAPDKVINFTNTGTIAFTIGQLTGSDLSTYADTANQYGTLLDFTAGVDTDAIGFDSCTGAQLAPGQNCAVGVTFTPATPGQKTGTVIFPVTYADNTTGTYTANLSGYSTYDTDAMSINPSYYVFPDQPINQPASPILASLNYDFIELDNESSLQVTVGTPSGQNVVLGSSTKGDFVVTGGFGQFCSGTTIAALPGYPVDGTGGTFGNCFMLVYFVPKTAGIRTGSVNIPVTFADGKTWVYSAKFTGNGIVPVNTVVVSPTSAQFNPQILGTTDPNNNTVIAVTNDGNVPVSFTASTLSSKDFTLSSDGCAGKSIQPANSCTITVLFTPQSADSPGAISGTLTINDSATGHPHTVSLTGTVITSSQQLTVSQSTISFGPQAINTSSDPEAVYVINQGSDVSIPLKSVVLKSTADLADFTESDTCGGASGETLGPRSSCAITVIFNPVATSSGTRHATVTVTPVKGSPIVITITGDETD